MRARIVRSCLTADRAPTRDGLKPAGGFGEGICMGDKKKIAFLILAHNDPAHLKRLINALDDPAFDCYIHVDAKSDIDVFDFDSYRLQHSGMTVLKNRRKVFWADYSVSLATMDLFAAAYQKHPDYCRYVVLSGSDYPIKSNREIYDRLTKDHTEFICDMENPDDRKTKYYHFMRHNGSLLTKARLILGEKIKLVRNRRPLTLGGKPCKVHFSPQWIALTDEAVGYLLDIYRADRKSIDAFFKYSYASDELMFATLLFSDKRFKEQASIHAPSSGVHYNELPPIHLIDYEPTVRVFTDDDRSLVLGSDKLFCRKLISGKSDALVSIIEKERESDCSENK